MSGPAVPDDPSDRQPPGDEDPAGEYVLGVLDAEAMAALRQQAQSNAALARSIADWERRLLPLAATIPPAAAPGGLWPRIEASLSAAARVTPLARVLRSPAVWRATTATALALAAAFAGLVVLRPPPPLAVASLAPAGAPAPAFLARVRADGEVVVRPLTPLAVPSDRDLELWALAAGAARPLSLGVISAAGLSVTVPQMPATDTQLLVSLEPKGGSPTGQPTGPVLYGGRLAMIE
jgi:anti-sigma-K factor RskA